MLLRTLLLSSALTFSATATATTLTFDELVPLKLIGASYEAGGFLLTGTPYSPNSSISEAQFRAVDVPTGNGATSPGLFMGGPASRINLKASTGALFNAISIDLDESYSYRYGVTEPVSFTGIKEDGTKVSTRYSFTIGVPKSETFVFGSEFRDIQSLQWSQGAIGHSFDNINVVLASSVPEPSTIWLFAPLVAALSLWSQKRKRLAIVTTR